MTNPGNVARGLKGAINNQNNSEEARADAQRRLDDMNQRGEVDGAEAHAAQVKQGHKAAMSNPNTSEERKQHSKQVVEDMDV